LEHATADVTALEEAEQLGLEHATADVTALEEAEQLGLEHATADVTALEEAEQLVFVLVFLVRQANADKHSLKRTHSQEYDPNV
jgi:hypothetical protein